ncbi:MAG: DEAD/DEAH box helicase [Melioribacteraceae bacterium]|nr:DEAD/DEAH box helicase [Melioribacteraceae bacterium]
MLKLFKTIKEKLGLGNREKKTVQEVSAPPKQRKPLDKKKKDFAEKKNIEKKNINKPQPRNKNFKPKKQYNKAQWTIAEFKVDKVEGKKRFHDFSIPRSIMHAIYDLGFKYCTPIQAGILNDTLKGSDAIGKAQTGTGKTAAFLIAIYAKLIRSKTQKERKPGTPRALILAPTRELVIQIAKDSEALGKHNKFKTMAVYGGMDYKKQKEMLKTQVVDIVVATSGRLLDFMQNKEIDLSEVEILVIDEADAMLDMGFIPDVKKIVRATPHKDKRQTLFFSATINIDVENLSYSWTNEAVKVEIEPEIIATQTINKLTYTIPDDEKYNLLYNIIKSENLNKVIIFCNRKDETRYVHRKLYNNGIECGVLSSDVDQKKRVRTLEGFREGKIHALIATDVASRGIHIDAVSHVINWTLPDDPGDYVHRIGRTGRAGADGTFVNLASEIDSFNIPAIEEFIGEKLECSHPSEDLMKKAPRPARRMEPQAKPQQKNYNRNDKSGKPRRYSSSRRPVDNKAGHTKNPHKPHPKQSKDENKEG